MTRSTALDPGLEGKGGLVLKVQCARRWVPFPSSPSSLNAVLRFPIFSE